MKRPAGHSRNLFFRGLAAVLSFVWGTLLFGIGRFALHLGTFHRDPSARTGQSDPNATSVIGLVVVAVVAAVVMIATPASGGGGMSRVTNGAADTSG